MTEETADPIVYELEQPPGWPIRVGILSDIHVGPGARSKDLAPAWRALSDDPGYIDRFGDFLKTIDRLDAIVLPGDVTDSAEPMEVELAGTLINRILDSAQLTWDDAFIVPGNHDVSWDLLRDFPHDSSGYSERHRYDTFRHDGFVLEARLAAGAGHPCEAPYFAIWESARLLVIGLNTSSEDHPSASPHHGSFPAASTRQLDIALARYPVIPGQARLAVGHHHMTDVPSPVDTDPDFSQLQGATDLLDVLGVHKVDVVVHGHKHVPFFRTALDGGAWPLVIVGAGSFGAALNTRYSGLVTNQFHVLEFSHRDSMSGSAAGALTSWSYLVGRSWAPSRPEHGIEHREFFGPLAATTFLASQLERLFSAFKAGGDAYLALRDVRGLIPSLGLVSMKTGRRAILEAATKVGVTIWGSMPDEVILRDRP